MMTNRLNKSLASCAMPKRRSVLLSLVMLLSLMPLVPGRAATSCDDDQVSAAFKGIAPEGIKAIQQDLILIGHHNVKWVDGKLGPRTTRALVRFCRDLAVDAHEGLPATELVALTRYADFVRHTPDWREVVANPDFARWLGQQSSQRQRYFKAIQTGGGVLPITILADYRAAATPVPPPADVSVPPQDDSAVYYRLSAADFAELQGKGAILQQLEGLKDVEYPNPYSLKSAVEKALAELTQSGGKYAELALTVAHQNVSYRLTDAAFDQLRIDNMPETALTPLQEIKDLPYPSLAKLENAVMLRLEQAAEAQAAAAPPAPTLPEAPANPAGQAAPEPQTPAAEQTDAKTQAEPKDGAETQEKAATQAPTPTTAQTDTPVQATSEDQSKPQVPAPTDYSKIVRQITDQAKEVTVYQLTDQSFQKLAEKPELQAIPAALLSMIGKLQDVEFIDQQLLIQAIHATIDIQTTYYQNLIVAAAGKALQINQQTLENLTAKDVPDYIMELIKPLQKASYSDLSEFEKALLEVMKKPQADISKEVLDQVLVQQARRIAPEKLSSIPIRWDGGSCGCARELSGVVYGFYPFWLAKVPEGADSTEAKQVLDFSTLTRIGYYGVYLDERGEISQSRHWRNDQDNLGFVKTAEKYRTYLDLVVYTNTWDIWTEREMNKAAKAVADKMALPLPAASGSRLSGWLPFGADATPTLGDGVTVYFDDFTNPAKAELRKNIPSFLQKLWQALQDNPKRLSLNVMIEIRWDELGDQTPIFSEFSELLIDQDSGEDSRNLLLVLLEEPTSNTKKELRRRIENEFKGQNRKTVLRKIIPIVSPTGHDKEPGKAYAQFTDDLIYFEDNFYGVGLWPLPLVQNADTRKVNELIADYFKPKKEEQDVVERAVRQYLPQLCNYACPNRWQFRILFDILAVALILLALVTLSNCRLRQWLKQYPWPAMALLAAIILVFGVSLLCDPFWKQLQDDVILGLLTAIILIGLGRYIRKINQGKLP